MTPNNLPQQIIDAMKKLNQAESGEPKCTCREDDKYARALCPVCNKEEYDKRSKLSEEMKKPKTAPMTPNAHPDKGGEKKEDWEYCLRSCIYTSLIGYSDSNGLSIPCKTRGEIEDNIVNKFKNELSLSKMEVKKIQP